LNANRADFLELSQELLDRGALIRFRAHGRSMHPFIKNGDILIVEPMKGKSPDIGDVIFYRHPDDTLTAHRLVKINDCGGNAVLFTKGDYLHNLDLPVQPEQVIGRVVQIEGSRKQLALTRWPGLIFGFFIAWLVRGHYPQQMRIIRNLGRLWWLVGGAGG